MDRFDPLSPHGSTGPINIAQVLLTDDLIAAAPEEARSAHARVSVSFQLERLVPCGLPGGPPAPRAAAAASRDEGDARAAAGSECEVRLASAQVGKIVQIILQKAGLNI